MDNESQDVRWTTVDRFFHPTDAHIAAGRIESEGIPVFLLGINHASVNWLLSIALGGIRIQVPAKYAEEARAILSEIPQPGHDQVTSCPKCGSDETSAMSNGPAVPQACIFNTTITAAGISRHFQPAGK